MNMVSFEDPTMASAVKFESTCCSIVKEGERKRSCKEPNCKLVGFDSLPGYLKDNEFVVDYYRCEWPLKQTILSIFSIHNETLNVWTHLIGFFIFLVLAVGTVKMVPIYTPPATIDHHTVSLGSANASRLGYMITLLSSEKLPSLSVWNDPGALADRPTERLSPINHTGKNVPNRLEDHTIRVKPITRWPFFAFLCGAMFCLFTSSACHLLSCHSEQCAYSMLRLDYTGITTLIVTSFYPVVYYTFMCDAFFLNLYIGFITVFGIATVLASLIPVFQTPEFRTVRALLFFCLAVSGLVPILHKMVAFGDRPEAVISTGYEMVMGLFYGVGVVVYATRVPERWMPGRFDLIGHSHQLFHVLVIAGAYTHYLSGLVYLQWRDMEVC